MRTPGRFLARFVLALSLVGCAGGAANGPANTQDGVIPLGKARASGTPSHYALYLPAGGILRGFGLVGNRIDVYRADARDNATPTRSIGGPNTQLMGFGGLSGAKLAPAVGPGGELYILRDVQRSPPQLLPAIFVYARGATGDVAPIRTITGFIPPLIVGQAIATDASGKIYVAFGKDILLGHVGIYAPSGEIIGAIGGPLTHVQDAHALTVDASGRLYVTNSVVTGPEVGGPCTSSILIFTPGATGNVAPDRRICGAGGDAIAVDASGNIYVGRAVYDSSAREDARPIRTLSLPDVAFVGGLAFDPDGNLYVLATTSYTTFPNNDVFVFDKTLRLIGTLHTPDADFGIAVGPL